MEKLEVLNQCLNLVSGLYERKGHVFKQSNIIKMYA